MLTYHIFETQEKRMFHNFYNLYKTCTRKGIIQFKIIPSVHLHLIVRFKTVPIHVPAKQEGLSKVICYLIQFNLPGQPVSKDANTVKKDRISKIYYNLPITTKTIISYFLTVVKFLFYCPDLELFERASHQGKSNYVSYCMVICLSM